MTTAYFLRPRRKRGSHLRLIVDRRGDDQAIDDGPAPSAEPVFDFRLSDDDMWLQIINQYWRMESLRRKS